MKFSEKTRKSTWTDLKWNCKRSYRVTCIGKGNKDNSMVGKRIPWWGTGSFHARARGQAQHWNEDYVPNFTG